MRNASTVSVHVVRLLLLQTLIDTWSPVSSIGKLTLAPQVSIGTVSHALLFSLLQTYTTFTQRNCKLDNTS